jgi:hypothetical protein
MINEQDFLDAISALKPDAPFQIVGTDYATLTMLDNSTKPTLAKIEAKIVELTNNKATEAATKAAEKAALLAKLGITDDEAKLLLS